MQFQVLKLSLQKAGGGGLARVSCFSATWVFVPIFCITASPIVFGPMNEYKDQGQTE
jgi:hypothetical protein